MRKIMWPVLALALLVSSPAYAGADLTGSVQIVVGDTPNAEGLVPVTFTITVTNQGDEACGSDWWVDFWILWPCECSVNPNDCAVMSDASWPGTEFGGLAPGQSVTLPIILYVEPSVETFTYLLYIDSMLIGACDEDDEENNIICGYYEVPLQIPDLAIEVFAAKEKFLEVDGQEVSGVGYLATIENIGTGPAGPFDVDLFFDAPAAPTPATAGDYDGHFFSVANGLAAGASIQLPPFLWGTLDGTPGIPPGIYTSWLVVDILDAVAEWNESNNVASASVAVMGGINPGGPNLEIGEFSCKVTGDSVLFEVEVRNTGDEDIDESFLVEISYVPAGFPGGEYSTEVPNLASGESFFWQKELEEISEGETTAYVLVDSQNVINELNEGDNHSEPCISVIEVEPSLSPDSDVIDVVDNTEVTGDVAVDAPRAEQDVAVGDNSPPSGEAGADCGCRMDAPARAGAGVGLLLVLVGLLGLLLHASTRKDHPTHHAHE